jgi:hypothetical protein
MINARLVSHPLDNCLYVIGASPKLEFQSRSW